MTASNNVVENNDDSARASSTAAADSIYPDVTLRRIAFGSCHKRGSRSELPSSEARTGPATTIWDAISSTARPQAFLWTGDAVYPSKKVRGDAPLSVMQNEYRRMLSDETLGYARFLSKENNILEGRVHGTWDDHDYGGNDRGRELKDREGRRDAYLDFLGVPKGDARWYRKGVYGSVEFGEDNSVGGGNSPRARSNKVKVIFLDTRWHRGRHCIPSVGSSPYVPYGALVACVTRLITAKFDLPSILPSWTSCSDNGEVLGEDQWTWLERQLKDSDASMHVIVSSIQVLTTNPVVESWGHFPSERERLLRLLNDVPGLVILSGDVHHAEISTTARRRNQFVDRTEGETPSPKAVNDGAIVEVTSSGLTHSCDEPFYGPLCKPILDAFPTHRFEGGNTKNEDGPSYFTGRNFGSIDIDWSSRSFRVNVHDDSGGVVLSSGNLGMDTVSGMSDEDIGTVAKCIDGHFRLMLRQASPYCVGLLLFSLYFCYLNANALHRNRYLKKTKRA